MLLPKFQCVFVPQGCLSPCHRHEREDNALLCGICVHVSVCESLLMCDLESVRERAALFLCICVWVRGYVLVFVVLLYVCGVFEYVWFIYLYFV